MSIWKGAIVQLKSGGPLMTACSKPGYLIDKTGGPLTDTLYVDCQWFIPEGELKTATFMTESLIEFERVINESEDEGEDEESEDEDEDEG